MAEIKLIISEEMIERATDYLPFATKTAWAKTVAEECIEQVEVEFEGNDVNKTFALPALYQENNIMKNLYLMRAFLDLYIHIEVPETFGTEDYDTFAKTHPFCQMERLKKNREVADKVFDILADFRELEKLLNTEIYNLAQAKNNNLNRLLAGVSVLSTPETIERITKELNKAATELVAKTEQVKNKEDK